jgi:PDZ domain-containing protein
MALLAAFVFAAATLGSDDFLYIPGDAEPVAAKVSVEGGQEPDDRGGIYYVDVSVRRARWLERLLPFVRPEGSTLVPEHAVVPPGGSFADRRVQARKEMDRSERVAAAVALKAAGLPVKTTATGVLVEGVAIDVPAATVLRTGDVIVAAEGDAVRTAAQLRATIATLEPGDELHMRVRRARKTVALTVKTVPSPDDADQALVGIRIAQDATVTLPRRVTIDLGDIGGPSAGLPFALQVYQELGTDVDRGLRVAATGEIQLDGSIGSVGGLKQKTVSVRNADADVFLVPAGENAATALRYAGDLRVIPVESFRQALRALETLPAK